MHIFVRVKYLCRTAGMYHLMWRYVLRNATLDSLCEHHGVNLHKPRLYGIVSLLLLGHEPVQYVTIQDTVSNCNTIVSICISKHM